MALRRPIARLIAAAFCAYVMVLQAAVGGVASARHDTSADPLGVICLNSDDAGGGATGEAATSGLGCCALGCVSVALASPLTPEISPFAYDPRPTPRRAVREQDRGPSDDLPPTVGRPRGPPSIG